MALHLERGAGLRPFGYLHGLVTIDARHRDVAAQRQRREGEWHFAVQVVAVTLEELVLGDVNDDVEIAGRPALRAGLALAGEAQALTGGDARRNLDRELPLLLGRALAAARGARLGDDLAGAAALTAGAGDGEEPLLVAELPGCRGTADTSSALVPGAAPEPLQVSHVSWRGIWMVVSAPLAACSNAISMS